MLKALGGFAVDITGRVEYQGTWDASTNTPTLASGVGTQGYYYVVSVAGSTNLDGITDWEVGDWVIFNGSVWEKVDNTDLVTSVNGQTGVVVLDYDDVGAPSNTGASASGTWPISITGSAASATNVNVAVEVANVSLYPLLVSSSGLNQPKIDGGNNIAYNPSTDTLTIPNISGTNVNVTTVTATTVDATNVEVTNIKAQDGTAAATIASSTGIITISTQLNVDNINISVNTISSTNTDGNIILDPNGSGVVQENVGGTNYNLASQYDVGTDPNQIPLNQYLGALAYEDTESPALDIGTGITTGTGTICVANGGLSGGVYKVTIVIDLTGLNSGGTAGDIIGVDGTALPCYIARLPAMTVLGGRMTCLELPAGGDTDIDLYSANEGTGTEDSAITGLTETQIINAGTQALGTLTYFSAYPTTNQYLYLVGQSTSDATYTAGRFLIEIFGVK